MQASDHAARDTAVYSDHLRLCRLANPVGGPVADASAKHDGRAGQSSLTLPKRNDLGFIPCDGDSEPVAGQAGRLVVQTVLDRLALVDALFHRNPSVAN